jgi:hypothetical protein
LGSTRSDASVCETEARITGADSAPRTYPLVRRSTLRRLRCSLEDLHNPSREFTNSRDQSRKDPDVATVNLASNVCRAIRSSKLLMLVDDFR